MNPFSFINLYLALFVVSIVVEYYSYQTIKTLVRNRSIRGIWTGISLGSVVIILIGGLTVDRNNKELVQFMLGLFMLIYTPKVVLAFTLILEDVLRIITFLFRKLSFIPSKEKNFFPERRKAISTIGIGLASIPFISVIEGIVWGKFDFKVRNLSLSFPDLPEEFHGYKIAQISDIHIGSFNWEDYNKIAEGIRLLNEQNPDVFFFTGDSINNYADEMEPWIPLLKTIKAKDGKYSILGNHDYGIYVFGKDDITAQEENIEKLDQYHKMIDWKLLQNESVKIEKGGKTINIVGVRNWGEGGHFPKDGDLELASQNISDGEFNILLSHDPSHFDEKVKMFSRKIHLTLSGHTHGMQFGIEIPGIIKWSPVKYRYPKWADLYQENGRYLYVNRGFGYLGFPGRVGIRPEITIIELKKG
ncbi:MAG: metallophosphoesterase [Flavobacteriaceae bacterium]|jgi:predicted MPP superfamily phosphohydrolase|nr:metallophosphoesterase [Flavobacteriaceae bacterium]